MIPGTLPLTMSQVRHFLPCCCVTRAVATVLTGLVVRVWQRFVSCLVWETALRDGMSPQAMRLPSADCFLHNHQWDMSSNGAVIRNWEGATEVGFSSRPKMSKVTRSWVYNEPRGRVDALAWNSLDLRSTCWARWVYISLRCCWSRTQKDLPLQHVLKSGPTG
jgi:hypothetical protein